MKTDAKDYCNYTPIASEYITSMGLTVSDNSTSDSNTDAVNPYVYFQVCTINLMVKTIAWFMTNEGGLVYVGESGNGNDIDAV